MHWRFLVGMLMLGLAAQAETITPQTLGTIGAGTQWEATLYGAYDLRMFFPFRGCLTPKDRESYVSALQDKDSRAQLKTELDNLVQPAGSTFRQVLAQGANPNLALKTSVHSALLDTVDGSRTAYWPGIEWSDNGKYGSMGFEPCDANSFRVEKKETRVLRSQTVDSLLQTTEPLQPGAVTLKIFAVTVHESAPNEAPGTVQLLQDGHKHFCFTAQDVQGAAVTSFSAYKAGDDGYKVHFPVLTEKLKSDLALVKTLSPFYQYAGNTHLPTAKKDAYSLRYGAIVEQEDLGIQIQLCGKYDEPYATDQLEYVHLAKQ